jgi:glycosyltransferase involved in cell wall biosynthesis
VLIKGSGVALGRYRVVPEPCGRPIVVFASRLLVTKGVREFVQAARLLRQRGAAARFWLVGKIDEGNPLTIDEAEYARWQQQGDVEILGHRTDMPEIFAQASIVALPSYYGEGVPKVLLEAAACGRPVVTTDHPGCRDAIRENLTGLLVPAQDARSLADAIETLLVDPGKRKAMGAAARAYAEQEFDVNSVVGRHLRLYRDLLGSH